MPVELLDARLVEAAHHRQEAGLVRGNLEVGGAEQERLVALVGAAVDQVGGLGVGARDDDAGHPHDVELEAGGVEALDLLVRRDQHLAALMAALLGARALVLDVVAGHAGLDEPADQVAHVRSPPWPVSASAMMNGRKSTAGVAARWSSVIRRRRYC